MKCYKEGEYGDEVLTACERHLQVDILWWLAVGVAGVFALLAVLWLLGMVHDWFADRYGAEEPEPETATTNTRSPIR